MDYMRRNAGEAGQGPGGRLSVTIGPLDPTVYIYSFTVDA